MSRALHVSGVIIALAWSLSTSFAQERQIEDAPLYRKWRAAAGGFEVEAELLTNERDKVVLKRKDNSKELSLSPDKLSNADRQYLTALAQLEGYWELTTIESGGAVMPNKPNNTYHFERGKFKVLDKEGIVAQGHIELELTKIPRTLDLVGKDLRVRGIYQFDGGNLKICSGEGEDRPVNFSTKGPKPFYLATLKKVDKPPVAVVAAPGVVGAPSVPATPTVATTNVPPPAVNPAAPASSSPASPQPASGPREPLTAAIVFRLPQSEIDKVLALDRSPKLNIPSEAEKAFLKEVEAAKGPLAELPQFKAKYDALKANPESESDRADLAQLLHQYWTDEKLAEKSPVQERAVLEEVERLSLNTRVWADAIWSLGKQFKAAQFPLSGESVRKRAIAALPGAVKRTLVAKPDPKDVQLLLYVSDNLFREALFADDAFAISDLVTALKPMNVHPVQRLHNAIHYANLTQGAILINSNRAAVTLGEKAMFLYLEAAGAPKHEQYRDPIRDVFKRAQLAYDGTVAGVQLSIDANHAAANYDRGVQLVAIHGKWQEALKHFALGKDAQYKELALATQTAAAPEAKLAVAGRWAELGAAADSPAREMARLLLQSVLADSGVSGDTESAAKGALEKMGPSIFTPVLISPPR